jgi:hypothetical protein
MVVRAAPAQRRSTLRVLGVLTLSLMAAGLAAIPSWAQSSFRFSDEGKKTEQQEADRAQRLQQLVSAPCQARLKSQRILLLVAEESEGARQTAQDRYTPLISLIDARLKALGLKTYTQEQIRHEIAQAEIDAYFNNDPDRALAASKRLAARYILRGEIVSKRSLDSQLGLNAVAIDLSFTLAAANGHTLSQVSSHSESYSGHDTLAMALTLVREQADEIVGQLYHDYCSANPT